MIRSLKMYMIILTICLVNTSGVSPSSAAEEWMVRRATMSGICHVQLKTASPLGSDLSGPFASRKAACESAKSLYDTSGTDSTKCSGYGQGTVDGCKKDSVVLP